MAGSMSAIVDQWEVQYERFFFIPPAPVLVPYPLVVPQGTKGGCVWSLMTKASLKIIAGGSSDCVLNLSVPSEVLEEHRVSQLHFTWFQVSSASGFPARWTTAVVRFKDSLQQFPKFRLNFLTTDEAERFLSLLKEIRGARGDQVAASYSEMPSVQVEPLYRSKESLRNTISADASNCEGNQIFSYEDRAVTMEAKQGPEPEEYHPVSPPSSTSFLKDGCPEPEQGNRPASRRHKHNMSSEKMLKYILSTEEEIRRSKEDKQKKPDHGYSVSSGIWQVLPYN